MRRRRVCSTSSAMHVLQFTDTKCKQIYNLFVWGCFVNVLCCVLLLSRIHAENTTHFLINNIKSFRCQSSMMFTKLLERRAADKHTHMNNVHSPDNYV